MGYSSDRFTWRKSKKKKNNIKERLDRFVSIDKLRNKFKRANIIHLNYHTSDHRPILANLSKDPVTAAKRKKARPIRFEDSWSTFEECKIIIGNHWKNQSRDGLMNF